MTEGQGVAAESAPRAGAGGGYAVARAPALATAAPTAPADPGPGLPSGTGQPPEPVEPHVRVDARRLESALLGLRHQLVEAPLLLEAPGVVEARSERHKMLSQIDDYLLPRLRQSGAPILVALVGSTGAGKSTLLNSLVGTKVSATGIRRPTTNSPVLACHPSDVGWFAENVFLPTLPRVRQEGLAMPGRDGLLVLAASEGMPQGVALLDTPDIDSVVKAHREFAHQFLDASDLWLFMTSARRYADAAVWQLLQQAADRSASLSLVLSRVPRAASRQLTAHFEAMLDANGLASVRRFVIPETELRDEQLPPEIYRPVRRWLEETAGQEERRVAILTQTMSGVLDTFRGRAPELAGHVETQLTLRSELRASVDGAYAAGRAGIDEATRNGDLLRGEILARWQDFAGTGDLLRMLQVRKTGRPIARTRRRRIPARASALKSAIRAGLETLVASVADRAAEDAVSRWRQHPAGAALLDQLTGPAEPGAAELSQFAMAADLDFIPASGNEPQPRDGRPTSGADLARSSPDLATRSARAISGWQDQLLRLVQAENVTKRSVSRVVSFDQESLALVLAVAMLGFGRGDAAVSEGASAVPQRLLTSLFGAVLVRDLGARARADLHDRIRLLFDEEAQRFEQVLDSAGVPDATAAAQLQQAAYTLETAR